MVTTGRGGMGSTKHGKSGYVTQSPKFRANLKREAEANEIKSKNQIKEPYDSVADIFKKK